MDGDLLKPGEKELYHKIVQEQSNRLLLEESLLILSEWLHRYHKKCVVLLIDEYDTPIHAAYVGKYYEPMISILRNWISKGFKDNVYLERGVLTGILRIAKESIFSGANNISTFTILNETFADKFGLLEFEVIELLENHGLVDKLPAISQWYDGYRIGSCTGLHNPWSVLKCISEDGALFPYWVNTSDNILMKQLIAKGTESLKADVEELLNGSVVERNIAEGIVFSDLETNPNVLWSLLLYSGYVTIDATPSYGVPYRLRIPNVEVGELYKTMILDWFEASINEYKYRLALSSLVSGDIDTFSIIFEEFMLASVSVFDVPAEDSEKIYHAFVLGMLIGLKDDYEVKSNRESGLGRYDVMLIPKNKDKLGIIMEFKKISRFEKIDLERKLQNSICLLKSCFLAPFKCLFSAMCNTLSSKRHLKGAKNHRFFQAKRVLQFPLEKGVVSALKQIEDRHYAQELLDRGITRILYIGCAFEGKRVLIRSKFKPGLCEKPLVERKKSC